MWAILPAAVRYDPELPPNAKLLFAEIAAKTNTLGFCFAHNQWFAERLRVSPDRISALVKALENAGYITIDIEAGRDNRDRRHIYIAPSAWVGIGENAETPSRQKCRDGIGENAETPSRQKCRDGIGENAETLKYKIKKTLNFGDLQVERPGYMELAVFLEIGAYCGEDGELMLAYMGWAESRNKMHKPIASVETVRRANKKLDAFSAGSRAYKIGLLHKATDRRWTGIFDLKPGDEGFATEQRQNGGYETWT